MSEKQPKNQLGLAFTERGRGEASEPSEQGTETRIANRSDESPAYGGSLMEEVCERENLKQALKRVKANRGSAGIDGMTVEKLPAHLEKHWPTIREQLLRGTYKPKPVKRVEIPKPDGGMRQLGIPTVLDRFIQQAVLQVLQKQWDPTFSPHSHGFRPNHSAHDAVAEAQRYVAEGYEWVVDLDLEKFFDRVNHDRLMSRLAERISDKRMLKLIRSFLNAGVMEDGLVSPTGEGTPQGGPLSPLLSNIVLDELDRELEKRGHRFVRYADDCNIYVRSERAGQRVMATVSRFIIRKLKLKVNEQKSAVGKPQQRKFLGFTLLRSEMVKRAIAPQSIKRFKRRIRVITRRSRGVSIMAVVAELNEFLRGWRNYYSFCETPSVLERLDKWLRRRLRCMIWVQWKTTENRLQELQRRGVPRALAVPVAASSLGPWHLSHTKALTRALPNVFFSKSLRLLTLATTG